jgi:hypothetical protein
VRPLTPVEAAAAFAVIGSLVATALPSFARNLHASRLVEPIDGLNKIATRATALAAGRPAAEAYPESVGLTPPEVPRGVRVTDPPGTWDKPTWRELEFSFTEPHCYSFSFESHDAPGKATFHAVAHGDLDGDGVLSTFEISGSSKDGSDPTVSPLEMHREIE